MAVNSFSSNQGTQSALLTDNTGGTAGTLIPVMKISTDGQGTFTPGNIWAGGVTGTINSGSIVVTAGTIASDTVVGGTLQNLVSGTINLATVSGNLGTIGTIGLATISGNVGVSSGTINVSTISSLPNLPQGSINVTAGTIATLGTMGTLGSVIGVGSISNIAALALGTVYKGIGAGQSGSLTAAGTITAAGSQLDLTYFDIQGTYVGTVFFEGQIGTSGWFGVNAITPTGAIGTQTTGNGDYMISMAALDNVRARVTYSSGTLTYNNRSSNFFSPLHYSMGGTLGNVGMLNGGTINTGTINTGTFVMTSGTLNVGTATTNQASGTLNVGTINAATINSGTIQLNPLTATNTISNVGTSGTTAIGTLLGTTSIGAGTAVYITYFNILGISGTPECTLAFGSQTNGAQVIYHGLIPAGGGITATKTFGHGYGTTNSPLTYQINSGAGTVSWSVDYFLHT